ncbi:MAG: tRNA (adenosine(37)-N6)-threonylcarbamoyltransferase complex dimerization subunit type 1 TsaB [Elusimicrobia bacterium]|nr:tRNA (adenosine(37)-N6)-threonylcarbamoyltransferase complex dimerization subunit type 1 TsaB [Elusimicrobiota bacterium]
MILAIDSSTKSLSLALTDNSGAVIKEVFVLNDQLRHSDVLFQQLDKITRGIKLEQLAKIACTTGPGSFTGIRIGLSFARTLSQIYNIPLVGVSTLDALARQSEASKAFFICPLIPAQQENVYIALYKTEGTKFKRLIAPKLQNIKDVKNLFKHTPVIFTGEGALKYKELLKTLFPDSKILTDTKFIFPKASTIALIASKKKGTSFRKVVPTYFQLPRLSKNPKN